MGRNAALRPLAHSKDETWCSALSPDMHSNDCICCANTQAICETQPQQAGSLFGGLILAMQQSGPAADSPAFTLLAILVSTLSPSVLQPFCFSLTSLTITTFAPALTPSSNPPAQVSPQKTTTLSDCELSSPESMHSNGSGPHLGQQQGPQQALCRHSCAQQALHVQQQGPLQLHHCPHAPPHLGGKTSAAWHEGDLHVLSHLREPSVQVTRCCAPAC